MIAKSPSPFLCRCCGRPIAKSTGTVIVRRGPSQYDHQHKGWRYVYAPGDLKTKADCLRHTNQKIISMKYTVDTKDGDPDPSTKRVASFQEWDGVSYVDEMFCTLRCASQFGYMAARTNKVQSVAYADAMRRAAGLPVR